MPLVRVTGKGRKQRIVPLMPATAQLVRQYLEETNPPLHEHSPLLRNYRGQPLTRSGVTFLLDKYRRLAVHQMPALRRKGISPHTLRHTKAMHLLQAGVSPVTIKDILGHVHLKTLEVYVQADVEMMRKALESTPSPVVLFPARRTQDTNPTCCAGWRSCSYARGPPLNMPSTQESAGLLHIKTRWTYEK
jgi:site-specific recombinase XerD